MASELPRGRGRLNSIDLLPVEAEEAVSWAFGQLRDRKLTQEQILEQMNEKLAALDLGPISRSAFNRAAVRTARMAQRLGEVREIATSLASRFEDGGDEHLTLLVSETIKSLVFEILENPGPLPANGKTAEMMANFALALKSAEQAKKVTADTKKLIEANFAKKADEAIQKAAKVRGLSAETIDTIKSEILGIRINREPSAA